MLAPAGTPRHILDKLNKVTIASIRSPELMRIYAAQGINPRPSTPAEFAKYLDSEIEKWVRVVRDGNIQQM
jgi:tripartite-type tricarboxylate transporter receptor subunit TctC